MKAMIIKEFRELARDRRTVALLIILPILLLTVFGYAANFTVKITDALVAGPAAQQVVDELKDNTVAADDLALEVRTDDPSEDEILELLRTGEYATIIRATDADTAKPLANRTHVWTDGSKLFTAQAASGTWMRVLSEDVKTRVADLRADMTDARAKAEAARSDLETARTHIGELKTTLTGLQEALTAMRNSGANPAAIQQAASQLANLPALPDMSALDALQSAELPELPDTSAIDLDAVDADTVITVAFNPDLKTSWVMIPGLIGLILTFVGTIVTSIGLVREREAGTLEQLAVMPLSPAAIILGKVTPYLILALFDAAIISVLGIWIFGVPFTGSVVVFSLTAFIFVFVVLGLGILISSVSQTTGQAIQMSIMVMVPQMLLSGFIFPLEHMAAGVRWIGYCLPLTWFYKAVVAIFLKGASISQVALPFWILCAYAVVVFGAATARMAVALRHGGATR